MVFSDLSLSSPPAGKPQIRHGKLNPRHAKHFNNTVRPQTSHRKMCPAAVSQ